MQHRVQAYSFFQSFVGIGTEFIEQFFAVVIVEGVYNLIGEPYETINGVYGRMKLGRQRTNAQRKRGAVALRYQFADALAGLFIQFHGLLKFVRWLIWS